MKVSFLGVSSSLAALCAVVAIPAHAGTSFIIWTGQVSAASDGMTKGISETDGNAQVVANITATHGPLFAGVNLKNVKTPEGADQQEQWFAGAKGKLGGFDVSARVWLKINDYARPGTDSHFLEYQADVSRTFGKTTAKVLYLYSPDFYATTKQASWLEASLTEKLSPKWSVSGGYGVRTTKPKKNYNAWNLGATYAVLPRTSLDLRYYDTDQHDFGKKYDSRFVVMLTQKF